MKSTPKPKIGKILTWDPDTRVGWIRCQISSIEFREYYFDWHCKPELYFPIKGDRVRFEILAGKGGDTIQSVQFLRTC